MTKFEFNGFTYRTNADASIVEALSTKGAWVKTSSLSVWGEAKAALRREADETLNDFNYVGSRHHY